MRSVCRVVSCRGGPALSARGTQCISGGAVGGRPRQTYRKDQPQRSTFTLSLIHTVHTRAHFQSVYSATIDSSTVMSSGFPPAEKRQKGVRSCAKPNYQVMRGRAGIFPQGYLELIANLGSSCFPFCEMSKVFFLAQLCVVTLVLENVFFFIFSM